MDNTTQTYTPNTEFLPICRADMEARGWDELDFVVVGGDAYVDPAPLYRLRGFQAVWQAEIRLLYRRRQRGQHGQPLFGGQDPPGGG